MLDLGMTAVYIGGLVVLLFALMGIIAYYYVRVPPNRVAVVFGRRVRDAEGNAVGFRLVQGGGFVKWPIVVSVEWLSLEVMAIPVTTVGSVTIDGVPVKAESLANIKIGSTEALQRAAAERFLTMGQPQIHELIQQMMEGHLRAIIGTMTVEDLIRNRAAFSERLVEQSARDLETMGLVIDNMPIREITDEHGYIEALGQKRTAEVRRDAQIGMAEAQRDADIKASEARRVGEPAKILADVGLAEADKNKRINVAQFDADANAARARADQAGPLAEAQARQEVEVQQVRILEVQRKAQIAVAEQEAARMEQELVATRIRPAEADQKKAVIDAEARRQAAIVEAEGARQSAIIRAQGERDARIAAAEAEQAQLEKAGAGEGSRARATGEGEAEAIRAKGLAEADAIRAQMLAEAEGMQSKAEARDRYGDAAVIQLLVERYPEIIRAMGAPMNAIGTGLSNIDNISIVDVGGSGDGKGPIDRVISQVPGQFIQFNEQVKSLLGLDLADMLAQRVQAHAAPPTPTPPPAKPAEPAAPVPPSETA
ncbi:MAG: SPFH domain-containing protein [Armatimonadia bacterium]